MSHSKNSILKTALILALISGTVIFASKQADSANARLALQNVETTSANVVGGVTDKTDVVRKSWQRLDVQDKISDLQHKTRPIGQKLAAEIGPKITPSVRAVKKGERRMSLPAMLLIFVFGGVFVFMGMSGPASKLGGHH